MRVKAESMENLDDVVEFKSGAPDRVELNTACRLAVS